ELKAKYEEEKKQYPTRYDMPEEARDIKYILVTVTASEADKTALTEEMTEYAAALNQGENLSNIVREAHSSISYNGVPMSRKALPADIAAIVDSVAPGSIVGPTVGPDNTMNVVKYIAKVQQPDSVQYRTISIPGTDAQAVQRADSILTALNGGAIIDSIAKRYNQAAQEMWLTSAQVDGATLRDDDKKFVETAFSTPAGSYRKLEVSGGNIIVKVSDRRNIIDKYDVAIIKRPIDFSEDTHNKIWNDLSEFIAANPTQADIEANAPQKGYTVMTSEYMIAGSHYVANVHGTTDALRWVFNDKTKIGDISELYEAGNANDQLLVVMLTGIHKKGWRSLEDEDLKQFISEEVIKDKKAERIQAQMKDAKSLMDIAKIQGAVQDTISQITFSSPAFVMKTASSEPALSGAATGAKMGQFVKGIKGNGGVYGFLVINKKTLNGKFEAKQEKVQLSSAYMRSLNLLMPTLARKANVTDNRYKFYQ
ncbi:MAG: peptidylprolyl isomerase, partial [Bacteroidaceae bacterium]|nr:peptidylprolyl isomerase [Bacteroidaceae bacterium]